MASIFFVAKFDSDGAFVWAEEGGGSGDDFDSGVAVDADENVNVTGIFQSSSILIESYSLVNSGGWDIFIDENSPQQAAGYLTLSPIGP